MHGHAPERAQKHVRMPRHELAKLRLELRPGLGKINAADNTRVQHLAFRGVGERIEPSAVPPRSMTGLPQRGQVNTGSVEWPTVILMPGSSSSSGCEEFFFEECAMMSRIGAAITPIINRIRASMIYPLLFQMRQSVAGEKHSSPATVFVCVVEKSRIEAEVLVALTAARHIAFIRAA